VAFNGMHHGRGFFGIVVAVSSARGAARLRAHFSVDSWVAGEALRGHLSNCRLLRPGRVGGGQARLIRPCFYGGVAIRGVLRSPRSP